MLPKHALAYISLYKSPSPDLRTPQYCIKQMGTQVPTKQYKNIHPTMLLAAFIRLCATAAGFKDWALYQNCCRLYEAFSLLSLPEVCWNPLNYSCLHIQAKQWWSQWCHFRDVLPYFRNTTEP